MICQHAALGAGAICLMDSIAAEQALLPLTSEQKAELDRRLDAYESNGNRGRPANEVIEDIRRRL